MKDESEKIDHWDIFIKLLIKKANETNANFIQADNHRCASYENWCVTLIIKKHSECDK